MADNYGNDEVFEWMTAKKPKTYRGKMGRPTLAEQEARKKATKEAARAELHAKQQAEAEWVSPVDDETLAKWNSIQNDFWFN